MGHRLLINLEPDGSGTAVVVSRAEDVSAIDQEFRVLVRSRARGQRRGPELVEHAQTFFGFLVESVATGSIGGAAWASFPALRRLLSQTASKSDETGSTAGDLEALAAEAAQSFLGFDGQVRVTDAERVDDGS